MPQSQFKTREILAVIFITIMIAVMDISGLPSILFVNIKVADINPIYVTLMINFILIGIICFIGIKLFSPHWVLGLKCKNIISGLKKYGFPGILAMVISFLAFYIGLQPFDNNPSIWKVIFEGFIYYIGVGFVEELYVRGLLLNIIEKLLYKKERATFMAVVISSFIFGIGHIFGSIGNPSFVVISKVIWTIGLGLYLGAVYKKTNCLWVPIILHIIIDFSGVPFTFSRTFYYPEISLWIILPVYFLLGVYGMYILRKE